jgi:hypothetical protein
MALAWCRMNLQRTILDTIFDVKLLLRLIKLWRTLRSYEFLSALIELVLVKEGNLSHTFISIKPLVERQLHLILFWFDLKWALKRLILDKRSDANIIVVVTRFNGWRNFLMILTVAHLSKLKLNYFNSIYCDGQLFQIKIT